MAVVTVSRIGPVFALLDSLGLSVRMILISVMSRFMHRAVAGRLLAVSFSMTGFKFLSVATGDIMFMVLAVTVMQNRFSLTNFEMSVRIVYGRQLAGAD